MSSNTKQGVRNLNGPSKRKKDDSPQCKHENVSFSFVDSEEFYTIEVFTCDHCGDSLTGLEVQALDNRDFGSRFAKSAPTY